MTKKNSISLVQVDNDEFATRLLQANDKWATKIITLDVTYLAAISGPYGDEEALRMMTDWHHWVSPTIDCMNRVETC